MYAEHHDLTHDGNLNAIDEEAVPSDADSIDNPDAWLLKPADSSADSSGAESSNSPSRKWSPATQVSDELKVVGFYPSYASHGDQLIANEKGDIYNKVFPAFMKGREGCALMLDTGSQTNLIGSERVEEMEQYDLGNNRRGIGSSAISP